MSIVLASYGSALADARSKLKATPELRELMADEVGAEALHAFLIQWAALSIQLHEPAERLFVTASRRSSEVGAHRLAREFLAIASEAIDRYSRLATDTRRLAQLWNARHQGGLELTALLTQPWTPGMSRLQAHYEALVAGPEPWLALAATYEAEALLGSVVERVRGQAVRVLGEEIGGCLSSFDALARFKERSSLGRTMKNFVARNPECAGQMAACGRETLTLYSEFLLECRDMSAEFAAGAGLRAARA